MKNLEYGQTSGLLQYFQDKLLENPSFYYGVQLDVEEQITNIFWADAKMIIDYAHFCDVVTFDTTYSTNNAYSFAGFNHFRGVVTFGAALLYDETAESFKWLFETFLQAAHKQKKPHTMFTDQDHDHAMAKALQEVMPQTLHGLCTFHLMQNGIKHLGNILKNGSNFLRDFKACMFQYEEESDFQIAWDKLLRDFNLQENKWLTNLYKIKKKWAKCFMKHAFTIGMRSTQVSESLNVDLKSCLKPGLDICQFFKHFEKVVSDKQYNELQCEFECRQKLPRLKMETSPLLQQVSKIYTPVIFYIFQKEYDLFSAACIKQRNEGESTSEYMVGMVHSDKEFKVLFNTVDKTVSCSCRKFETFGISCCHALKTFDRNDIKLVPSHYILKRWTRGAKNGFVQDTKGRTIQEDDKLNSTQRYRQICPKLVSLATQASDCKEAYVYLNKAVEGLAREIEGICKRNLDLENDSTHASFFTLNSSESVMHQNLDLHMVKGLKKKMM